jgi:hypothetical protein
LPNSHISKINISSTSRSAEGEATAIPKNTRSQTWKRQVSKIDNTTNSENNTDPEVEDKSLEFTHFPKLPPELRLKIWKEACYIPRVVDLWVEDPSKYEEDDWNNNDSPEPLTYVSHTRVPAVLQVSKEARAVALQHYTPLPSPGIEKQKGAEESSQSEDSYSRSCPIYINWQCDIVCPVEIPYEIEEDVLHDFLE